MAIDAAKLPLDILIAVGLTIVPLSIVATAVALILRFRRATGVRRLQLKWLMAAGASIAGFYGISLAAELPGGFSTSDVPTWLAILRVVSVLNFALLPIAIGVAITRHGLYGIDALISRALTVAVLGAFITGVYVGIVVGVGALIGQRNPSVVLSVLATGLVAVAFQPVRERVEHLVNRLVYGARATPYEVLSDFAVRLAGRYTPDELMPRLARTLAEALGGGQVEIWLGGTRGLSRAAVWPEGPDAPTPWWKDRWPTGWCRSGTGTRCWA